MKILLSAGEISGDRIGARLAEAIRRIDPAAELAGCAGPAMRRAGTAPLADPADFSHAGWQSVAARAPRILWRAFRYLAAVRAFGPHLVVAVDAPGLHARLLDGFRRRGVRCAWVAPPQLWAWTNRSPRILRGLDVFPLHAFEVESLRRAGARAVWHGYPGPRPPRGEGPRDMLALLPGSRGPWRRRHARLFLAAATRAETGLRPVFVHPDPPSATERGVPCLAPEDALGRAALALALPGTGTLEIALQGIPFVVAARPSLLDSHLARGKLSGGPYALPSRIAGRVVCPELLGSNVDSAGIASALRRVLTGATDGFLDDFRCRLGPDDAADRIVRDLLPMHGRPD